MNPEEKFEKQTSSLSSEKETLKSEHNKEVDSSFSEKKHDLSSSLEDKSKQHADKPLHPPYEDFLKKLELLQNPEEQIQSAIEFMEFTLSQTAAPHFKSFWDARQICLDLFKKNIPAPLRTQLWTKYSELSKEARSLKEILDEQSAFAAEQIDIAIQALETEIAHFEERLETAPLLNFSIESKYLKPELPFYQSIQRKLNVLNAQASRINALRKELIKTEMRIKQKNRFFQQLSAAGDHIFPLRKTLIKEISDRFIEDVDRFIHIYFKKQGIQESIFLLKEEIKSLQNLAKVLTLNTHSFTDTRLKLSQCWDLLKEADKERKKERAQLKQTYKQHVDEVLKKITDFEADFQSGRLSILEANQNIDAIFRFMKNLDLGREEFKSLKEALSIAKKPLLEKMQEEEKAKAAQEEEKQKQQKQLVLKLKEEVTFLFEASESMDAQTLSQKKEELFAKIQGTSLPKSDKIELEKCLKPFQDLIAEKKEQALMNLSEDDRQALLQLKEALKQRKERRLEIKTQMDAYKKAAGSSGLGFEQAMNLRAAFEEEKERLEKCNAGILEIEQKIAEVQSRV